MESNNMALDKQKIKALCFDVDGTLSDTDDQFVENLVHRLSPVGFAFPNRDPRPFARRFVMFTESPGNWAYDLADRLGIDNVLARLGDRIYRLGLGKAPKPFLLIPGVKEMLIELEQHYPMSVVSARGERSTGWFLDQFELTPLFHSVVTAQTCHYTKPRPDPILHAARQMGVEPEDCLMVGDTTVDILSARAAGAQSVGVLCGFGEQDELIQAGTDIILETTAELVEELIG